MPRDDAVGVPLLRAPNLAAGSFASIGSTGRNGRGGASSDCWIPRFVRNIWLCGITFSGSPLAALPFPPKRKLLQRSIGEWEQRVKPNSLISPTMLARIKDFAILGYGWYISRGNSMRHVLQHALEEATAELPALLLQNLISKKLRQQGIQPPKGLPAKMAEHFLAGNREPFKYDGRKLQKTSNSHSLRPMRISSKGR